MTLVDLIQRMRTDADFRAKVIGVIRDARDAFAPLEACEALGFSRDQLAAASGIVHIFMLTLCASLGPHAGDTPAMNAMAEMTARALAAMGIEPDDILAPTPPTPDNVLH